MRENDIIKNLKNIEKSDDVQICDIKCPLALFNFGASKYVAALRAAHILSVLPIEYVDWDLFTEIVVDTDSFFADETEVEFIQEVFLEVLNNANSDISIVLNETSINVSQKEYENFGEYIVSWDEIELFKNIYIDFICAAISKYKESFREFIITLKLSNRWLSAIYTKEKSFKKKIDHFTQSFYSFWAYNGLQNVKLYVKRGLFGSTCIYFKLTNTI